MSRKFKYENSIVISVIHSAQGAAENSRKLLSEDKVDGIIATNDLIAIGVGQAIIATNSRCKVVSFDDFPTAKLMGIKTLDHDPARLGQLAAKVLLERIKNPSQSKFVTENMKLALKNPTLKSVVNNA